MYGQNIFLRLEYSSKFTPLLFFLLSVLFWEDFPALPVVQKQME